MTAKYAYEKLTGRMTQADTTTNAKSLGQSKVTSAKALLPGSQGARNMLQSFLHRPYRVAQFLQTGMATPAHLKRTLNDTSMYKGATALSFIGITICVYAIGCMVTGRAENRTK